MPDVSVTITPTGYAYQVAREIIDALHRQCPESSACVDFEPHVTVQLVRGAEQIEPIVHVVEAVARRTAPFEVKFGSVGSFESPLGVHVNLEPTRGLLDLYVAIKSSLDALGYATYPYDVQSWRPHLTLSCAHWSAEDVAFIRGMFTRLDASFTAELLTLNRLDPPSEHWVRIVDVPLTGDASDRDARAA